TLKPQQLRPASCISTLNDLQQLLGTINWICLILGISTRELSTLFDTLKGDADLNSL
ncbi:POK18 protein, partial [Psophia crepitans]|nr:POK18 protein [Psophia crepitans]